jgi:hypothetical protein
MLDPGKFNRSSRAVSLESRFLMRIQSTMTGFPVRSHPPMCQIPQSYGSGGQPAPIRLFDPQSPMPMSARWRINGHPTRLFIWSAEEWERLRERPADAQYHPLGFWCALRVE